MARHRLVKQEVHTVFDSIEEFRATYATLPVIEDWREGQAQDWVCTDDGCIVQVLKRGMAGTRPYLQTCCGLYPATPKHKMGSNFRPSITSFSGKIPDDRHKDTPTRREILFAKFVAHGEDPVAAYLKTFPTNNPRYANIRVKALLNTRRIQKVISEEIRKAAEDVGVGPEYILQKTKDIVETQEVGDPKAALKGLDQLADYTGIKNKETKTEGTMMLAQFGSDALVRLGDPDEESPPILPPGMGEGSRPDHLSSLRPTTDPTE